PSAKAAARHRPTSAARPHPRPPPSSECVRGQCCRRRFPTDLPILVCLVLPCLAPCTVMTITVYSMTYCVPLLNSFLSKPGFSFGKPGVSAQRAVRSANTRPEDTSQPTPMQCLQFVFSTHWAL